MPEEGGRILVTGASGLLGSQLCQALVAAGSEVVALSRRPPLPGGAGGVAQAGAAGLRWASGDVGSAGPWQDEIDGARAVFHLAGEPVAGGRWTSARKARLVSSRVESTRLIVEAIAAAERPPEAFVCASATGYYGPRGDEELTEDSAPGNDFLARLCSDWEQAAEQAARSGVRPVMLRFGVILSRKGGALSRMLPVFRLGAGGPLGPADRYFPWVHEADALDLALRALVPGEAALRGPVNVVAPDQVRMGEFARALGRALHRPSLLPMPLAVLRLALGEAAEGLVPGQRVIPRQALDAGYRFQQGQLDDALASLV